VALDRSQKQISLSSIFKWYAPDFGANQGERLRFVAGYLDKAEDRSFIEDHAAVLKVCYQPYDWRLNQ
jgi:hypothetical protein